MRVAIKHRCRGLALEDAGTAGLVENTHVLLYGRSPIVHAICAYIARRLVTLELLGSVGDAVIR